MPSNDNRWSRAVSGWILRDVNQNAGKPPTGWSNFSVKSFNRYEALRVPHEKRSHWGTLARLEQVEVLLRPARTSSSNGRTDDTG
ncbi:hypothetical protein RB195_015352 [Necator americanus]|uniref:Uncharacterized protein n=1 Tax=Necator americanus TaxID=51031 RepID=A0ABR1E496_NECAM